jgi:hypothetical protein
MNKQLQQQQLVVLLIPTMVEVVEQLQQEVKLFNPLSPKTTGSRAAATRSVLPQAATIFTDELPPDYLLPATVALHQISKRGDALTSRCALPLKRHLKNHGCQHSLLKENAKK